MSLELLLEAVHFVEKNHPDHDYAGPPLARQEPKSRLRDYHNRLERRRRADLRDSLDELRRTVPADIGEDATEGRLSTVRLLRGAASHAAWLGRRRLEVDFEIQKLDMKLEQLQEEIGRYSSQEEKTSPNPSS